MGAELKLRNAPVFLVGATASGKSAAGVELARRCGGAILCMDAMQVYRGAEIGTSKPTAEERGEIPHGGLDIVDFGQGFDVAQYLRNAAIFLREQEEAGRRVFIVGGAGLYFRALTRGLCEAPQGPEELRAELSGLSVEALRDRLGKVDPGMLERIDGANPRRLVRAIEVMEATGKSLKEWQDETPEPLVRDFTAYWICREKEELAQRIEARVEAMFAEGWVKEVRRLIGKYGVEMVRGFVGIGYREIGEMISRHDATKEGKPDQISKLAKFPNGELGKVSHGGLQRTAEEGERGSLDGINGITELEEGEKGGNETTGAGTGEQDQISKLAKFPNSRDGEGSHGGLQRAEKEGEGVNRVTELGEEGSNEIWERGGERTQSPSLLAEVKSDILVATRQYAKRQLTWFAREPNLQKVMLTGNQSILAAEPALL